MYGGPQERNKRPGTENLNAILATSYAMEIAYKNMKKKMNTLKN